MPDKSTDGLQLNMPALQLCMSSGFDVQQCGCNGRIAVHFGTLLSIECYSDVQQPIWSLDMALNNETIVDQDLVAWVMLGIVHVPRSEVTLCRPEILLFLDPLYHKASRLN